MSQTTQTPSQRKRNPFTRGYIVAFLLAVITGIEFYAALHFNSATIMFILAIAKAYLVLNYFMHVTSLWSTEEDH